MSRSTEKQEELENKITKSQISYLNYIEPNFPLDYKQLKSATQQDLTLSKVIFYTTKGWPNIKNKLEFKSFYIKRLEPSIEQGLLMCGYKIVIPIKFRERLLEEFYSSHMGIVRMKSFARYFIWWSDINKHRWRVVKLVKGINLRLKKLN